MAQPVTLHPACSEHCCTTESSSMMFPFRSAVQDGDVSAQVGQSCRLNVTVALAATAEQPPVVVWTAAGFDEQVSPHPASASRAAGARASRRFMADLRARVPGATRGAARRFKAQNGGWPLSQSVPHTVAFG